MKIICNKSYKNADFCEGKDDKLRFDRGGSPVADLHPGTCAAQELVCESQALGPPSPQRQKWI